MKALRNKYKKGMKLTTKMVILFFVIILVPLVAASITFIGFGYRENLDFIHELSSEDVMVGELINRRVLRHFEMLMFLTLVTISAVIMFWIRKDIYAPIKQIKTAMQNIADGNFECRLPETRDAEIGQLFGNYEQMRLRLKENAEEKVENERKQKELISNISHDLKTPITSIKGYIEGIMDGVANTPEKMDKYIKTIYNKANDMDRLINELTTYSGIDTNKIPYNFHILNISDYFSDCIEEIGLDLESKNIHLNYTNLAAPDTCVVADPEQMKKVINNIISNSVKYMGHDNGVIDISILEENESVKIELEDNGRGIAQKDIGNIFERFYRADASRNSMQGGSGIGLSIVKKIIEDHGGYVWATSKEGEGTCMHFILRKYIKSDDEVVF
ncbi:MAG: HAMP domain-containing histidine kinase [Lachnospiraceae bacterium]|nr:HAMP domain-containing histidine kinase [Lachnospiraceae bacterium]